MKKIVLMLVFLCLVLLSLTAKEMQLYRNDTGSQQFKTLTAEEQYNSIINSFKGIADTQQVGKWVIRMVEQYGREILPYMNKTLMDADLDHVDREPYDITLKLHYYIFNELVDNNLLTEEEKELYCIIIRGKINEYILKYRVKDGGVLRGYQLLDILGYEYQENEGSLEYYEQLLGITGLITADDIQWKALESPLAEYITD